MVISRLLLSILGASALLACGKPDAAPADSAPVVQLGEPLDSNLLEHRTGIGPCDLYVDQLNHCLLSTPGAEEQEARLGEMKQHLGGWLTQKERGGDLATIERDCQRVAETVRGELRSKGCAP